MATSNGNGHPKSYSRFTLADLKKLGISIKKAPLFLQTKPVSPSPALLEYLDTPREIHLGGEKSKSEFMIAPIIRELVLLNRNKFAVYSGETFEVSPEEGLTGTCDYIFSKDVEALSAQAPVFFIEEAKNENLEIGTAQLVAEMYAARRYNEQEGRPSKQIYGVVTYGREWQFYQLNDQTATRDTKIYNITELSSILGILQEIVDKS